MGREARALTASSGAYHPHQREKQRGNGNHRHRMSSIGRFFEKPRPLRYTSEVPVGRRAHDLGMLWWPGVSAGGQYLGDIMEKATKPEGRVTFRKQGGVMIVPACGEDSRQIAAPT